MSSRMAIIENNDDDCSEPLSYHNNKSRCFQIKPLTLLKMHDYFYYIHFFLSCALLTIFIIRIFWIIDEYRYISQSNLPVSRDWWEIIKNAFHFNIITWVLIVLSLITIGFICRLPSYIVFWRNLSWPLLFGYIIVLFVSHFSQLHDSKFYNVLHIRNSNLLDYGSGIAYSYYHGYLQIIGPTHGDQRKGITERLDNYEDRENVTIPVKRLFIIVPMTSYIPTQLSEGSGGRLSPSKSLEKLIIDRAGVKNRTYENMIYKISGPNQWYVCAEGATPVLTLNEALKFEPHLEYLKEEILIKFYHTLKYLINKHEKTRNKFDVILYNDKENLGDVLEQRISQILNENNDKILKT